MILCCGLLKQIARARVILRAADAILQHQAELKLRFSIGLCSFRQQAARADRISGDRAAFTGERSKIADTARIAALRRTLE